MCDFERLVVESFTKLITNEVTQIKFPHSLTVKQREIIHYSRKGYKNGLNSKSEGTRYRILYLFKDSREVEKQCFCSQSKILCPVCENYMLSAKASELMCHGCIKINLKK
jgi:hypothetical protein